MVSLTGWAILGQKVRASAKCH